MKPYLHTSGVCNSGFTIYIRVNKSYALELCTPNDNPACLVIGIGRYITCKLEDALLSGICIKRHTNTGNRTTQLLVIVGHNWLWWHGLLYVPLSYKARKTVHSCNAKATLYKPNPKRKREGHPWEPSGDQTRWLCRDNFPVLVE